LPYGTNIGGLGDRWGFETTSQKGYQLMSTAENASEISTCADLLRYASLYIDEIKSSSAGAYLPKIALSLHRGIIERQFKPNASEHRKPIILEQNQKLILNLYAGKFKGIPPLALQGWLDLELFSYVIQKQPELYRFNFQKDILPLFNVSGSAVQLMRYLIHQIEIGLRQTLATEMILDAGHGLALLYYYYYSLTPTEEDKEDYRRYLPHSWLRAIFLCKKFADFQSVCLLSRSGISTALKRYWWQCHDHFTSDDRTLLENLVSTSHQYREEPFAFRLIEIFKWVKTNILEPPAS
jgi:hypothetical protein